MSVMDRRLPIDGSQQLTVAPAWWETEAEDPLAAPEWTLPARHVAVLAMAALLVSVALAWIG